MNAIRIENTQLEIKESVDFQRNKKLIFWINAASFITFILFYYTFYLIAHYFLGLKKLIFYLPGYNALYLIAALLVMTIVHELIHGLFFFLASAKPVFGFKNLFAFAGAPGWLIRKNYFLAVSLSPLIIITLTGFLLIYLLPPAYKSIVLLIIAANAAGSTGDLWVSLKLLRNHGDIYVQDDGLTLSIYK